MLGVAVGRMLLALTLWRELDLDRFWVERLPASRKGTRWDQVLFVLTVPAAGTRQRNGDCIANGLSAARWHICWARILRCGDSQLYACHDRLLANRNSCSITWSDDGAICSTSALTCRCTI